MTFQQFRRFSGAAAILLGATITIMMANQLADWVGYHDLVHATRHLASARIAGAVGATAVSFLAVIGRDALALYYAEARAPRSAVILAGICGTALGNTVGFAGLSAAAVRYRIYGAVGVKPEAVTRMIALVTLGFAFGLGGFFCLVSLVEAPALAPLAGWSAQALRAIAAGSLVGFCTIALLCGNRTFRLRGVAMAAPKPAVALALIGLTAADLLAAAVALWLLLPPTGMDILAFAAVFSAAVAIGGISHMPGGLGIFEAVFLFVFGKSLSPDLLTAGLILFRVIYFILPLLVSTALLASFELRRPAPGADTKLANSAAHLAPTFLAALTFAAGAILVVSGATPAFNHRLATLATYVPLWLIETAQFFASITGLMLMFAARGLYRRLDGAWWLATPLTLSASLLSMLYGLAYAQAALLSMLFIMLLVAHKQFPRRASLLRQPFTPGWWIAVTTVLAASVWIFNFAFQNAGLAQGAWWRVALYAQAPRALRATLGVCVLGAAFGLSQLLRAAKGRPARPSRRDLDQVARIVAGQDRSEALLALMGDKCLMFSASGLSFLMYATHGRSWIALYDPVGPRSEWGELIGRFVALAASHGGRAAFYHIRPASLPIYIDAGLQAVKLGEEASVDLIGFNLEGARRSHLRYALKRGKREGLAFELLRPEAAAPVLPILEDISRAWLAGRRSREKGFSVAAFERDYVAAQSIALIRQEGRPIAFASIMTGGEGGGATIGLMRHRTDISPYTMEFLFVSLILALQQAGFSSLSLGTAPLAGLSPTPLASRWYRLADILWRHGTMLYNFQGLRSFKAKFDPVWEPRYLAVSGSLGPFLALADAAALTNRAASRRLDP